MRKSERIECVPQWNHFSCVAGKHVVRLVDLAVPLSQQYIIYMAEIVYEYDIIKVGVLHRQFVNAIVRRA